MRLLRGTLAVLCLSLAAGCGDDPSSSTAPPSSPLVRSITTLTEDGGRLDWSANLNRIAFDRASSDGYFDIWTMNPDASAQTCLTCGRANFPERHIGNPAWHPSGAYIAFQAQKEGVTGPLQDFLANPGSGFNNDLYVMTTGAQQLWRLVNVVAGVGGILHPQFSGSGNQLLWAERVSTAGMFGTWVVRLADFRVTAGVPALDNIRTYTPGTQRIFYETHGFGPLDNDIIFSGNLDGQSELGLDIYRFNPTSGQLTNLTSTPSEWDEHAHWAPGGNRIAWMSSRGFPAVADPAQLRAEFWLMNPDGSGKTQLSRFNQAGTPEFIPGQAIAADLDWSPDGRRIAGYVVTSPAQIRGKIVMIDLNLPSVTEDAAAEPQPPAAEETLATATAQGVGESGVLTLDAIAGDPNLTAWSDLLADMESRGALIEQAAGEGVAAGRRLVRYAQHTGGVPVFRGEAVAQYEGGRLVSVFGTLYQRCGAVAAGIDREQATTIAARHVRLVGRNPLTFVALPRADGTCVPAFVGRGVNAAGPVAVFIDGISGAFTHETLAGGSRLSPDDHPPSPVEAGTKVMGGRHYAHDESRLPGIITLDLAGRVDRTARAFRGFELADIASDSGGAWDDLTVGVFHASAAAAYDALLSRFGRRGIGAGVPIVGMVHPRLGDSSTGPSAVALAEAGLHGGPFHAGDGILFVPGGDGQRVVTPRTVMYAIAQAVVDHTARLAPGGESAAVREAFAAMLRSTVTSGDMEAAGADGTVVAQALSIARMRLEQTGAGTRQDIDRVFFRAVSGLLPARATFAMTRNAMLQSARDVFGPASAVEAAVRAGWAATGH